MSAGGGRRANEGGGNGGAKKEKENPFSRIAEWFIKLGKKETELSVVLFGLDNAGKTTLLNLLSTDPDKDIVPTVGKNEAVFKFGRDFQVHLYDLGGGKSIRRIWKSFFGRAHAAIFMVDAADEVRFAQAKTELHAAMGDSMLMNKPLLILLNKQDRPGAMRVDKFVQKFEVQKLQSLGEPLVVECKARVGDDEDEAAGGGAAAQAAAAQAAAAAAAGAGASVADPRIQRAMEWLTKTVKTHHSALQKRVDTAVKVEASRMAALEAERESEVANMKAIREAAAAKHGVMENFICSECLQEPWKDCKKPKSIATDFRPVCDDCHAKLKQAYAKRAKPQCSLCKLRNAEMKSAVRFGSVKVCPTCNERLEGGETKEAIAAAPK